MKNSLLELISTNQMNMILEVLFRFTKFPKIFRCVLPEQCMLVTYPLMFQGTHYCCNPGQTGGFVQKKTRRLWSACECQISGRWRWGGGYEYDGNQSLSIYMYRCPMLLTLYKPDLLLSVSPWDVHCSFLLIFVRRSHILPRDDFSKNMRYLKSAKKKFVWKWNKKPQSGL